MQFRCLGKSLLGHALFKAHFPDSFAERSGDCQFLITIAFGHALRNQTRQASAIAH